MVAIGLGALGGYMAPALLAAGGPSRSARKLGKAEAMKTGPDRWQLRTGMGAVFGGLAAAGLAYASRKED